MGFHNADRFHGSTKKHDSRRSTTYYEYASSLLYADRNSDTPQRFNVFFSLHQFSGCVSRGTWSCYPQIYESFVWYLVLVVCTWPGFQAFHDEAQERFKGPKIRRIIDEIGTLAGFDNMLIWRPWQHHAPFKKTRSNPDPARIPSSAESPS